MVHTMADAFRVNFLGNSPHWYKLTIIGFLLLNPIIATYDPFLAGWALVLEFIFTLAMALKCYPLQPGGLLAVEAIVLGLASSEDVYHEAVKNFPVIMLLMFMVAGIYFLREMLLYTFTKILLGVRSKVLLSLLFSFVAAFLSAFLDALTVTAVIITVAVGFYGVYHKVASAQTPGQKMSQDDGDGDILEVHREDLVQFRAFLRSLMMHGAVGTALGGVTTLVGEPQNLLIAKIMGWEFLEFFVRMAHISMPVLVVGLLTCIGLEATKSFGYGAQLSPKVREVLEKYDSEQTGKRTMEERSVIVVQAIVAMILVVALGMHLAEPGVVGLLVIVLATAFNGVTEEHRIGHAFEEALPFTALLVVFFAIVAVIEHQGLFTPVIHWVMTYEGKVQEALFFSANGALSMISDNVFVATVYISEVEKMFLAGEITRDQFDALAVAINTGTNIPSVATPNGQAAFLFLLTSALAPLIRLSYGRMVVMALPYTITMSITGLLALWYLG